MYRKLASTADRIEAVLRERRAPAVVVGGRVLPGFVEMLLRPAPGTRVSQLKALQADLALALGNANVRLVQSGEHLAVHIPRAQRGVVRLSQLLQRAQQAPPYTAVLGLAEDGAVLMANLAAPEVAHVLIAGATGSGKTVLARTIVLSLCARHRPAQFGLVVIDPKLHGEDAFENAVRRHLLLPIARTPEAIQAAIARVVQAMEQRTPRDAAHPRVLVYVDELADVCHMGGSSVVEQLTRIAQRGREVGVHLLACTQKPTARAIGSLLKANLPLRLVGRVASPEDARVAAGRGGTNAERLLGSGDFLAVSGAGIVRFQAAYPDVT